MYERAQAIDGGRRNDTPRQRAGRKVVQRKLTVGHVDDPAEHEADEIASEVMRRLREGVGGGVDAGAGATRIQRATTSGAGRGRTPTGGEQEPRADAGGAAGRSEGWTIQRSGTPDAVGGSELTAAGERQLRAGAGGGAGGASGVLRRMESAFGADFGDVRIHTGSDVDVAAEGLQARAFTVGRDVYVRRRDYRPGTDAGDELIAHELTHTLQHGSSRIQRRAVDPVEVRARVDGPHVSFKKEKMHLDFIRMKRMDPQYSKIIGKMFGIDVGAEQSGGTYGHWWTEVGDLDPITNEFTFDDSYGWWPKDGVSGLGETLGGVEGALNAGDDQDPHAGEVAPTEFHPVMEVDTAKETYDQIRKRVTQKVDTVAKAYSGKWHWRLGWGKNCHTFQQHLKTKTDIHYQKSKKWLYDPAAMAAAQQKQQARQQEQQRIDAIKQRATSWHRVSATTITVLVDPKSGVEKTVETGGKIGPTGAATKDFMGFDCVEIVTDEGATGWIIKSEFKSNTGVDWAP